MRRNKKHVIKGPIVDASPVSLVKDAVILYAAVVSTASLLLALYLARRDRADVRVSIELAIVPMGLGVTQTMVWAKAVNRGRRKVVLKGFEFRLTNKELLTFPRALIDLPRELGEGEDFVGQIPLQTFEDIMKGKVPAGVRVAALVFRTADGRTYPSGAGPVSVRFWAWAALHRFRKGSSL
jgi:hypothetical protein